MELHGFWKPGEGLIVLFYYSALFLWNRVSHWAWQLGSIPDPPVSVHTPTVLELQAHITTPGFLTFFLGVWTQVLILAQTIFLLTELSSLPPPPLNVLAMLNLGKEPNVFCFMRWSLAIGGQGQDVNGLNMKCPSEAHMWKAWSAAGTIVFGRCWEC